MKNFPSLAARSQIALVPSSSVVALLLVSLVLLSGCGKSSSPGDDASNNPDQGENTSDDGGAGAPGSDVHGVTWHQDIAPLVHEKCSVCHTEGGIAPFSTSSYASAKLWAKHMEAAIRDGSMPPWGAIETDDCTPPASFKDDLRLSETEKDLFSQWIKDGLVEGTKDSAAKLPSTTSIQLEAPDRMLTVPSGIDVEGTDDEFICFTLDPQITEDVWLKGSQVQAGNPAIVHHALVYLDSSGSSKDLADETGKYNCFGGPQIANPTLLAAWAPGAIPSTLPENVGTPLHPGDQIVVQLHYHPTGAGVERDDSTRVDLKWTTDEPDNVGTIILIGNAGREDMVSFGGDGFGLTTGPDFLIPAGVTNHVEENQFLIPNGQEPGARLLPITLWMVGTHMHYIGTDMKLTRTDPDGNDQCLLQTPDWDFNWQRAYYYDKDYADLPALRAGDILKMSCTFDNSLNNPFLREALDSQGMTEPVDVQLGETTLDEMCLGIFGISVPKDFGSTIGL